MPSFEVRTAQSTYQSVVERGILQRAGEFVPARAGKVFVVTTQDVWNLHGEQLDTRISGHAEVIFFPGGETNKRLSCLEILADEMLQRGADRTSVVVGLGGGIVTDVGGFLAAIFMRGIPVLQIPTTLLAQVDAAVGGKTGVNLTAGKNLLGSFHQPLAVLIDPQVLTTLPEREYHAGLFEVIKCAIIRDPGLFRLLAGQAEAVRAREPSVLDELIGAAVRIKAEVVSADEREGGLRRILNFGHTIGHAMEAETRYERFLHGQAVGWGMLAAIRLAELTGELKSDDADAMRKLIQRYGPLPPATGLSPQKLVSRLASDKKTLQGSVHFVLPTAIGRVKIVKDIDNGKIEQAITESFN
jgi:3-dehydroquinate synthase